MVKLKDFITNLAKKAGYDVASDAAKPFFDALPETEVPEDIHKGIDNSLISLTDAKNNHPEIKNHYTGQTLSGVDAVLEELIKDFSLDEETKKQILSERSTFKRVPNLTRTLVELERKKLTTNSSKDKQEIQKQIDDLQAALKAEKEGRDADKQNFENQKKQDRINSRKNVLFSGLKTIHDELDPETKYSILDTLIQRALHDTGAKFEFDENGNFILLRNDGTNFYGENHQQIKPLQFIEQTLAKNKQIKVTQTSGQNTGNNSNGSAHQPPGSSNGTNGGNNGQTNYNTLVDRNKQALAEFDAATKNGTFGV